MTKMTKMGLFQLNLLTVLICLFTIIYPCEVGTIATPISQMVENEA